jgi:NAD(P)-dependent dehydrogenase (short-subunit alcohol dehydrogenase family)
MVAGIEVLIKTADGEVELFHQIRNGATRTPIWSLIVPTEDAERELEQRVSQTIPLGRFSEADEVAKAVLYLASDDSAILSGTEIVVDGGAGAPHGAPAFRRSGQKAA